MHPVPLSQREQLPLTLSRLCLGQCPVTVCTGAGLEPLWGMKQVGVTLATAEGATRNPRVGKVRREAPLSPLPQTSPGISSS